MDGWSWNTIVSFWGAFAVSFRECTSPVPGYLGGISWKMSIEPVFSHPSEESARQIGSFPQFSGVEHSKVHIWVANTYTIVGGFQPSWKIWAKMEIFPNFRGENNKYLKPPSSYHHPKGRNPHSELPPPIDIYIIFHLHLYLTLNFRPTTFPKS